MYVVRHRVRLPASVELSHLCPAGRQQCISVGTSADGERWREEHPDDEFLEHMPGNHVPGETRERNNQRKEHCHISVAQCPICTCTFSASACKGHGKDVRDCMTGIVPQWTIPSILSPEEKVLFEPTRDMVTTEAIDADIATIESGIEKLRKRVQELQQLKYTIGDGD